MIANKISTTKALVKVGRPTIYTKELAIKLCNRLREGRTATSIAKDHDMPCRTTLFYWLNEKEEFLNMYALARAEQLRMMHDEIIDLADATDYAHDKNLVNRQRLRMDGRKFTLAKSSAKAPTLWGSLVHQVNQVNDSFNNMYINAETADLLLKLITAKGQLKPIDEYGDKLKDIIDKLGKINDARNEQQAEKAETKQEKQNGSADENLG